MLGTVVDVWWKQNKRRVFDEVRATAYASRWDYQVLEQFEAAITERARSLIEDLAGDEYTGEEIAYHAETLGTEIAKWTWDRFTDPVGHSLKVKIYSEQGAPLVAALERAELLDLSDDERAAVTALREQISAQV